METAQNQVVYKHNQHRALTYTPEFKQFVRIHPGALKTAGNLIHELKTSLKEHESLDGVSVELTDKDRRYFKVGVGETYFFVKSYSSEAGPLEVLSSEEAKERVKHLPWAEVINFQFGFRHKEDVFFVSEWNDKLDVKKCTRLSDYTPKNEEEAADIERKIADLKAIFLDYIDFKNYNMLYDPESKKMYLFDLNKRRS